MLTITPSSQPVMSTLNGSRKKVLPMSAGITRNENTWRIPAIFTDFTSTTAKLAKKSSSSRKLPCLRTIEPVPLVQPLHGKAGYPLICQLIISEIRCVVKRVEYEGDIRVSESAAAEQLARLLRRRVLRLLRHALISLFVNALMDCCCSSMVLAWSRTVSSSFLSRSDVSSAKTAEPNEQRKDTHIANRSAFIESSKDNVDN